MLSFSQVQDTSYPSQNYDSKVLIRLFSFNWKCITYTFSSGEMFFLIIFKSWSKPVITGKGFFYCCYCCHHHWFLLLLIKLIFISGSKKLCDKYHGGHKCSNVLRLMCKPLPHDPSSKSIPRGLGKEVEHIPRARVHLLTLCPSSTWVGAWKPRATQPAPGWTPSSAGKEA